MSKIRIAVLVSGGGTNLQALLDAQKYGILKSGEIVLVLASRPGVYALERAAENDIPCAVVSRRELGSREAFEAALSRCLLEAGIELIILAGFLSILSADFTAQWPKRILNVHPSLIPSFCGEGYYGLRVHEAALQYGIKVTGATVHFVNEVPDGGEIILQKAVPVRKNDTPESLQQRVMQEAEWKLLPRAAELISKQIRRETRDGRI